MAEGVDAVKAELTSEFEISRCADHYDPETMSTVIGFQAEGRHFVVRVSEEFDEDYASGQVNVDLSTLGPLLRASKDGKARVTRSGISSS
jgi:hypothetical protein